MTDSRNRTGTAGILLHLVALGIIAVAMISLFGGAVFSLLTGNKAVTEASLGSSVIERREPELITPIDNEAALIRADAERRGSVPTDTPVPSQAQNPPRSDPSENAGGKPEVAPAPDRHKAEAAIPEDTPASKDGDKPADEAPPEQKPATIRVLLTGALGTAPVSSGSTAQILPTFDEERDRLFRDFQIEHRLERDKINSNRTTLEQPHNPHSSDGPARAHAAFRYRVRRECGPIDDPALYHDCIASLRTYYR